MSNSSTLHPSRARLMTFVGQLKVDGQRFAINASESDRVDDNALERAMIAYQRATDRLEEVVLGRASADVTVEPLKGAVTVDLLPGEVLEFISPLSAAIESTVRVLEYAKDDAKEALSVHLDVLLREQRIQLFSSPRPVRDHIGTV